MNKPRKRMGRILIAGVIAMILWGVFSFWLINTPTPAPMPTATAVECVEIGLSLEKDCLVDGGVDWELWLSLEENRDKTMTVKLSLHREGQAIKKLSSAMASPNETIMVQNKGATGKMIVLMSFNKNMETGVVVINGDNYTPKSKE